MEIKNGGPRQGTSLDQRFLDRSEAGVSGSSREQSGCRGLNEGESREGERFVGAGSWRPLQGCWLLLNEVGAI